MANNVETPRYAAVVDENIDQVSRKIRLGDLGQGALALAALVFGYALLVAVLDLSLGGSDAPGPLTARLIAFGAFLVALGWLGFRVVSRLLTPVNPYFAARQLEETIPDSKNSLINWLDLRDEPLPPVIRHAVGTRAARTVKDADPELVGTSREIGRLAVVSAIFLVGLIVLFAIVPRQFGSLMARAFLPVGPSTLASQTSIVVVKPAMGDVMVPAHQRVDFLVRIEGRVPEPNTPAAPALHFRATQTDVAVRVPLEEDNLGQWVARLTPDQLRSGIFWKITAGDAATPESQIRVRAHPFVLRWDATYQYRPYRKLDPETVSMPNEAMPQPRLLGHRGTDVVLRAHANAPVKSGRLELDLQGSKKILPAELPKSDPQTLVFRLGLEKSGTFRIHFETTDGEKNIDTSPYQIDVLEDAAPLVELVKPGTDLEAPANGTVLLAGLAQDDFGVVSLSLRLQLGGENAAVRPLASMPYRPKFRLRYDDGTYPTAVQYVDTLLLDQLDDAEGNRVGLVPGDEITYWLEATDNYDFGRANIGKSRTFKIVIKDGLKPKTEQTIERQNAQRIKQQHDERQKDEHDQQNQERNQAGGGDSKADPKGDNPNDGAGDAKNPGGNDAKSDEKSQASGNDPNPKDGMGNDGSSNDSSAKEDSPQGKNPQGGDSSKSNPRDSKKDPSQADSGRDPQAGDRSGDGKSPEDRNAPKSPDEQRRENLEKSLTPTLSKLGDDAKKDGSDTPSRSEPNRKDDASKSGSPKEGEPNDAASKKPTPKDGAPKEGTPKDGSPKDGSPKDDASKKGSKDASSAKDDGKQPKDDGKQAKDPGEKSGPDQGKGSQAKTSGDPKSDDGGDPKSAKTGPDKGDDPKSPTNPGAGNKDTGPGTAKSTDKKGDPSSVEQGKTSENAKLEPGQGDRKNSDPGKGQPAAKGEQGKDPMDPAGRNKDLSAKGKEGAPNPADGGEKGPTNPDAKNPALGKGETASKEPPTQAEIDALKDLLDKKSPDAADAAKSMAERARNLRDPDLKQELEDLLKKAGREDDVKAMNRPDREMLPEPKKESGDTAKEPGKLPNGQVGPNQGTEASPVTDTGGRGLFDELKAMTVDDRFAKRLSDLQLENLDDLKKRIGPEARKKANVSDAEWRQFLENARKYQELMKRLNRDDARVLRGSAGSMSPQSPRAVPSAPAAGAPLEAAPTTPPWEFRDAFERFTRKKG